MDKNYFRGPSAGFSIRSDQDFQAVGHVKGVLDKVRMMRKRGDTGIYLLVNRDGPFPGHTLSIEEFEREWNVKIDEEKSGDA